MLELAVELGDAVIVSKVNGKYMDLPTPMNDMIADTSSGKILVEFFSWDNPEGKETLWHSSAHVLGLALEQYPLTMGIFEEILMAVITFSYIMVIFYCVMDLLCLQVVSSMNLNPNGVLHLLIIVLSKSTSIDYYENVMRSNECQCPKNLP